MHWYTLNLNLHEIFGELYKNITTPRNANIAKIIDKFRFFSNFEKADIFFIYIK